MQPLGGSPTIKHRQWSWEEPSTPAEPEIALLAAGLPEEEKGEYVAHCVAFSKAATPEEFAECGLQLFRLLTALPRRLRSPLLLSLTALITVPKPCLVRELLNRFEPLPLQ